MVQYSFNNITLYMGNSSNLANVTFNVFDTLQNPLIGAKVSVLKYNPANNSYLLVSVKEANFAGKFVEAIELGTEFYKFIVEYDGDVVLTTTPSYIYENEVTLYANLLTSGFDELFRLTGLYSDIEYTAGNVVYTYSDSDGLVSQGCVYVYLYGDDFSFTLVNSTCGIGAANTLYLPVTNTSGLTYFVKGYVTKNGYDIYLINEWLVFSDELDTGRYGLILGFILLGVLAFVAYWRLELAVIMSGFAILIMSFTQIILLDVGYGVGIFMLALVAAFTIHRTRGGV